MRRHSLLPLLILTVTHAAVVFGADGVISGTVRLVGARPNIPTVLPDVDLDVCGSEARRTQLLALGSNQAVRNVIIYLAGLAQNGADTNDVVLDQRDCEFTPRIQVARSGAPLVLKNSDPILHVIRIESLSNSNGPRTLLQVATPYAGYAKSFQLANFREPTLLKASSANGHAWMAAYIAVLPHPWATVTDENGQFTLRHVPAGTLTVYAWHEVLGTLTRAVKLNGNRSATLDFEFGARK